MFPINLPTISASVIDGGIFLHEIVMQHSLVNIARDLLTKVCASQEGQVQLVLEKYNSSSIKDCERNLRKSDGSHQFHMNVPEQAQRQRGTKLLKNKGFKKEISRFLMDEWKKPQCEEIVGRK